MKILIMNKSRIQQFATICFVLGAIVFLVGCRPSVRQVTKILYGVPLGTSRDDMKKAVVEAFHKKYPDDQYDYFSDTSPRPVTEQMLNADKKLISICKEGHMYVRVYPTDLYDKMPSGALVEPMGIVAESSDGNGGVDIFYDSQMHCIGFLSDASGPDD
jgi:hypothetical protein